jgi:GTPase SAR1 family protein
MEISDVPKEQESDSAQALLNVFKKISNQNLPSETVNLANNGLSGTLNFRKFGVLGVKTIDLRNNKFEFLHPNVTKHNFTLKLEGNPLSLFPSQYRNAPWAVTKSWLQSTLDRAEAWNICKICIVGEEAAGKSALKSALFRSLEIKDLSSSQDLKSATDLIRTLRHTYVTEESDSALQVSFYRLASLRNKNREKSDLKFSLWEFTGKPGYFVAQQFFLSQTAIYLVVVNLRSCNSASIRRADFWVEQIRNLGSFSSHSKIIIVGTHLDKLTEEEANKAAQTLTQGLSKHSSHIIGFYLVSCKSALGLDELRQSIIKVAPSCLKWIPKPEPTWVAFYDFLLDLATLTPNISWSQFKNYTTQLDIPTSSLTQLVQFLRDAGALTYDQNEDMEITESFQPSGAQELMILNSQWLSDVITSVLGVQSTITNGHLLSSQLPTVFKKFQVDNPEQLISLLETYEIVYRMSDSEWLVPSLFPPELPSNLSEIWPAQLPGQCSEHGRLFELEFIPPHLFSRILVRLALTPSVKLLHEYCWKNGIIVQLDDQIGRLLFNETQQTFSVQVRFPNSNERVLFDAYSSLFRKIIEIIAVVLECFYPRFEANSKQLVPCTHCVEQRVLGLVPFYFTLEECIEAVTTGQVFLYCHHVPSPSRSVLVNLLAPDLSLADLPLLDDTLLEETGILLGSGGFGDVRQCIYKGAPVAVKQLKASEEFTRQQFNDFQREAYISR